MGKSNVAVNNFVKRPDIAADLFNGVVFGGRSVVQAKDLEPLDRKAEFLLTDKEGKMIPVERLRDVIHKWKNGPLLSIIACENQSYVDYSMPVRTMIYDGLSYQEQIDILWKQKGSSKTDSDEFLSHLRKEDKLIPVITLVLYYNTQEWDASVDLYGLLDLGEDEETKQIMKNYIPNYNINLVDTNTVEEKKFQTELQTVFGAVKRKGNRKEMEEYIKNNEFFKKMDEDTYDALGAMLNAEKQFEKMKKIDEGGQVNMCQALQEMWDSSYAKGKNEGKNEGIMEIISNMIQEEFSLEMIAKITKESVDVIAGLVKEIQEVQK